MILTAEEYDQLFNSCLEHREQTIISYKELLFNTIKKYASEPKQAPAAIAELLEPLSKEICKNHAVLYTATKNIGGYYELATGERSDQVGQQEWENLLAGHLQELLTTINDMATATAELLLKGDKAIKDFYKENANIELKKQEIAEARAILEEFSAYSDIDFIMDKIVKREPLSEKLNPFTANKVIKYVPYDTPVKTFTKLEVLKDQDLLNSYSLEAFIKDYPALYTAMQADMAGQFKGIPIEKGLTVRELNTIYEGKYEDLTDNTDKQIAEYLHSIGEHEKADRIEHNGIAILTEKTSKKSLNVDLFYALDNITEDIEEHLGFIKEKLFDPAARELIAYNKLIDLIIEITKVKPLEIAKVEDIPYLKELAEEYNKNLFFLYKIVSGSPEDKKRKRQLLKTYYKPIIWEDYSPKEETIAVVKELLNKGTYDEIVDFETIIKLIVQGLNI